jgi:hypothetical protein
MSMFFKRITAPSIKFWCGAVALFPYPAAEGGIAESFSTNCLRNWLAFPNVFG